VRNVACVRCGDVPSEIEIQSPGEYHTIMASARLCLSDGTLLLLHGTCDVQDILDGQPWPDDYMEHTFACTACGRRFELAVETYHGSGGHWRALSS
jgi:hypothetical protein